MHDKKILARLQPKTVSVFFGIIISVIIGLFLYTLGLSLLEASVFGVLGGFTMGAVLYREQNLIRLFEDTRKNLSYEVLQYKQRLQNMYDHSSCCLLEFDAETHAVHKASLGAVRLLAVPPDREVRGDSLLDVLRVESKCLVDLFSEAKAAPNGVIRKTVEIVNFNDRKLACEVSAIYYNDNGFIELALYLMPERHAEGDSNSKGRREDFDRFRRGLYRRESRILELKEEVNKILVKQNKKPRYKFDQRTNDSPAPLKLMRGIKNYPDERD